MPISKDVIIVWPSTNASIPSNFTRETLLDGRFPKGTATATNPSVTGGASTHTHTSSAHSHTLNNHTHTYVLDDCFGGSDTATTDNGGILACEHFHTGTSGASNGGTTSSDAVTFGSMSNNPPYYEVIFIKSQAEVPIPSGAIVFTQESVAPSGFSLCDGTNSTPDLRNKYLRGAATSGDAGGTGGSTANVHDISHSHTAQTHTHDAATSSNVQGHCFRFSTSGGTQGLGSHTHQVSLSAGTAPIDALSDTESPSETVEPAHRKLIAIQNISGVPLMPRNVIAMWLGSLASIPTGWVLCDGNNGTPNLMDYYLKVANDSSQINNTGGSNTHTHLNLDHSHTSTGTHTHPGGTISNHSGTRNPDGNGGIFDQASDQHAFSSISSNNATYASATINADSSSNEPLYRTVAYIQYQFDPSAGLLLALL